MDFGTETRFQAREALVTGRLLDPPRGSDVRRVVSTRIISLVEQSRVGWYTSRNVFPADFRPS